MDLSGIIFVLLAVAWAVFLIPKALKNHDELARTRSIDRFSTSTRVLAHREPVNDRDTKLVVTAARRTTSSTVSTSSRPHAGSPADVAADAPAIVAGTPLTRVATRAAARRRRRIIGFLLLCDVATAVVAYLGYVAWWSVAVPAALTVVYLVLCRTQVRHESVRSTRGARVVVERTATAAAETPVEQPVEPLTDDSVDEHRVADFDDDEDTVGISVAQLQAAGLTAAAADTLWDPLPVTLPTYVTKPKANRTVRTIDLGEPGTWTSGRTVEDAQIAAEATQADSAAGADQRAVGS